MSWRGTSRRRFGCEITVTAWLFVVALSLYSPSVTNGQQAPGAITPKVNRSDSDQPDKTISSDQAAAILIELREIRRLLEKQQVQLDRAFVPSAPPERVQLSVANNWNIVGSDEAPITLVEFTDLQCAFCRRFHAETFPLLKKNYIDTGKLRFVSRDMPLEFHHFAWKAAEATRCAGDQGKFWELRNAILEASPLSDESILKLGTELLPDTLKFRTCLNSEKYKGAIQTEAKEAATLQVSGTPTFVLARSKKGTLDGVRIVGNQSFSIFQEKIEELLASQTSQQ